MEKFDVSYRLPEDEDASLVGQLVQFERPSLPWEAESPLPVDVRKLSLICHMSEEAPGLVAWLTVRNHRFSAGLHWRRGVFLRHVAHASEALFELLDEHELSLTVRAPSPDYFFSILRDTIEDLVKRRWEGLAYDFLVPCPQVRQNGERCTGRFEFQSLLKCRERNKRTIDCPRCIESQDVGELLAGFALPEVPLQQGLDEMQERLDEVAAGVHRIEVHTAESASQVRMVLKAVSAEIIDCPRIFTLVPRRAHSLNVAKIWQDYLQLTLWYEHPGHMHAWVGAQYNFTRPKKWLRTVAPYALLVSKMLRLVVPVGGAVPGVVLPERELRGIRHQIELMKAIAAKLPKHGVSDETLVERDNELTLAEGAGLRALRVLLLEEDKPRSFGILRRVQDVSGDFLWICPDHYPEYDPGLPSLPG
jgi:internalin A